MNIRKFLKGSVIALVAVFATVVTSLASTTEVVTGNTSSGENQPGWLFNRDVSTSTPYEFNTDAFSLGSGSLYVKPIGATAADKFIAENFVNTPIANVNSISYDFKIGSGGVDTKEEHFYMNVYANFGVSDDLKFYDCRYNIVPTVGSTAGFTTVTFDPTQPYPVTTRGGSSASPFTCPSTPAEMDLQSAGSNIRVFALNVGDTSVNDQGLDGYLDNVVVNLDSGTTIYDFEKLVLPSVPTITNPANGSTVTPSILVKIDWTDSVAGTFPVAEYQYEAYSDATYSTLIYSSSWLNASEIPTPGTPIGEYYLRVRARDDHGNMSDWSNGVLSPYHLSVVADVVLLNPPTSKDQCKADGWKTFNNPPFASKKECEKYVKNLKRDGKAQGELKLGWPSQKIKFEVREEGDGDHEDDHGLGKIEYWNYEYPGKLHYKTQALCVNVNKDTREARFMFQIPSGYPGLSGLYVVAYTKDVLPKSAPDIYGHAATADLATATAWCETGVGFSPSMYPIINGKVEIKK